MESMAGSSRIAAGGSVTSSFEQAMGSLLLDGTPIGSFTAAKPTCRTVIARYVRPLLLSVCMWRIERSEDVCGAPATVTYELTFGSNYVINCA